MSLIRSVACYLHVCGYNFIVIMVYLKIILCVLIVTNYLSQILLHFDNDQSIIVTMIY